MKPHGGQPVAVAGAPIEERHAAMILLHGRHANPANILDLVPQLDRPAFTYLAPAAAHNTWYPWGFMAERETNEPDLTSALGVIAGLVDNLVARGVNMDRIVLLGFSQGACLAAEFAVRHPARYGGVVIFTGGLIGPRGTSWTMTGSFSGTPVVLGSSDVDAHVPVERVRESAEVFARMGASVTLRIYAGMGHVINGEELEMARHVMDTILAGTPARESGRLG